MKKSIVLETTVTGDTSLAALRPTLDAALAGPGPDGLLVTIRRVRVQSARVRVYVVAEQDPEEDYAAYSARMLAERWRAYQAAAGIGERLHLGPLTEVETEGD